MTKSYKVQDMASEYRFDYKKAKPNRFANKMNLNVNWTVEKFVEGEKVKKVESGKQKAAKKVAKAKPAAKAKSKPKAKAPAKTKSPKGKVVKKPVTKAKTKKKK